MTLMDAEVESQSPPNPDPAAEPSEASREAGGSTSQAAEGAKRAQPSPSAIDRNRVIYDSLNRGRSVDEARKDAATADPTQQTPGTPGEGETVSSADRMEAFDGLDSKTRQALSQTHLLPSAEAWNKAPPKWRESLISSAKQLLAQSSREFQRQRDAQGRFAPNDGQQQQTFENPAAGTAPAQAAPLEGAGSLPSPAGTQDVRAQRPAAAPATSQNPPADLMAPFKAFAEQLGDETLSKPFIEGYQGLINGVQQSFGQLQQQFQAELRQHEKINAYLIARAEASEEQHARETLGKEIPELTAGRTPAEKQAAAALWDKVRNQAQIFARASVDSGQPWSWGESLIMAGRAVLNPNIQTHAQRALANTRSATLAGSAERGTEEARPHRTLTKDELDRAKFAALEAGKSADQVRQEFQ
jgi:hypothetical protein